MLMFCCNCFVNIAYIPPHLRGGGGSNQQRSADGFQDNYHGGRSGGGRGRREKSVLISMYLVVMYTWLNDVCDQYYNYRQIWLTFVHTQFTF